MKGKQHTTMQWSNKQAGAGFVESKSYTKSNNTHSGWPLFLLPFTLSREQLWGNWKEDDHGQEEEEQRGVSVFCWRYLFAITFVYRVCM